MRKLALFLLILSFFATASTCRKREAGVVTVALPDKFTTLDTLTTEKSDAAAERLKNLIFNTMVRKNENFEYVGELAKEIITSEDGLKITFKLQDGVKFHNGKEFTSADVKYTFDELFRSSGFKKGAFYDSVPLGKPGPSPAPKADTTGSDTNANTAPKVAETKTKLVPHITLIETPDPKTVVFTVTRPALRNQLLANLVAVPIIPEGTIAQQKETPVGTGPFKFVNFDASQNIVEFAANTDYWEGPPKVQKMRLKTMVDATSLQAELTTGAVDIAPNPSNLLPDTIKALSSSSNLKIDQTEGSNIQYVVFNTQLAPLDNVKVRQAIAYAIDREKIVSDLLFDQAKPADSVLPAQSWAFTTGTKYQCDPEKAKQLVKESGYKNEPIIFKYASGSAYVNQYSQVIQSSLVDIGLNVQIETLERNTIIAQLAQGQVQMYTGIFVGGNQDPIFLRDLFSSTKIPTPTLVGFNRSRYVNAEVDKTVEDAINSTDKTIAKDLYGKVWNTVSGEVPILPLWYPANIVVSNRRIGNAKMNGSGDWTFLKDITVE